MSTPGLQTRLHLAVLLVLSQRNSTKGKHSGNIQNQKYIYYGINYKFTGKDKFFRAIRKQLHIHFGLGLLSVLTLVSFYFITLLVKLVS